MTVIPPEDNDGSSNHHNKFREEWGIPFGRPGNALDYAQTIFGVIAVSYNVLRLGEADDYRTNT
jgi:hypothetical protein